MTRRGNTKSAKIMPVAIRRNACPVAVSPSRNRVPAGVVAFAQLSQQYARIPHPGPQSPFQVWLKGVQQIRRFRPWSDSCLASGSFRYRRTVLRSNPVIPLIAWMLNPCRFSSVISFTSSPLNRSGDLLSSRVRPRSKLSPAGGIFQRPYGGLLFAPALTHIANAWDCGPDAANFSDCNRNKHKAACTTTVLRRFQLLASR